MQTYSFWADLFDTYQSLPVFLQTLWLVVPPVFVAVMFWLYLNYRLAMKQVYQMPPEEIGPVVSYPPTTLDALVEKEMKALMK